MSFEQSGITFYTPDEFALATLTNIDTIICQKNTFFYRVAKSYFSDASHRHHELYQPDHTTKCISTDGLDRLYIQPPSTLHLQSLNNFVQIKSVSDKIYLYTGLDKTVQTDSTKNTTMLASAFVEWSMKAIKEDIFDLDQGIDKLKALKPKKYKIGGKDKYGFVVESSPKEIVYETTDEEGKKVSGVDLMSPVAINTQALLELTARVEALEQK